MFIHILVKDAQGIGSFATTCHYLRGLPLPQARVSGPKEGIGPKIRPAERFGVAAKRAGANLASANLDSICRKYPCRLAGGAMLVRRIVRDDLHLNTPV